MKILMVCLGNICRSPIAEGVLKHKVREHGLDWTIHSAGTEPYHVGEAPHRFSQKVCLAKGIDISSQRARRFTFVDFDRYDKIYAMATDVYNEIRRIGGGNADMSNVDHFLNELERGCNASVPDPWYGTEEGYHTVYDMIDKTCEAIIAAYKER